MLLLLLTVFAPMSMSLYLPVLPALTAELGTTTATAQLTLTACLVGLGTGQVVAGPLSDRLGRRRPLLVGIAAYILASALCATAPTVEALIGARFLQGFSGAVGIVIAQASGRDVYEGPPLIRLYARQTVFGGMAAVVGPVLGGQLATVADWRGVFVCVGLLGVVLLAMSVVHFKETLDGDGRVERRARRFHHDLRRLGADRVFVGAVLVRGLTHAALFAYLAGATYLLQDSYGLSPQEYSLAFAANSVGFMAFGHLGGILASGWSERGALALGLAIGGVGASCLVVTGALDAPLAAVLASLWVHAAGIACASPATASLALAEHPDAAGTASSLLGLSQFGLGAVAAPLVGLAGSDVGVPLGAVCLGAIALAVLAHVTLIGRRSPASPPRTQEDA